jgi:hypothetical protein
LKHLDHGVDEIADATEQAAYAVHENVEPQRDAQQCVGKGQIIGPLPLPIHQVSTCGDSSRKDLRIRPASGTGAGRFTSYLFDFAGSISSQLFSRPRTMCIVGIREASPGHPALCLIAACPELAPILIQLHGAAIGPVGSAEGSWRKLEI